VKVALVLALYGALIVVPSVICWLKGKRLWAVLGSVSLWHLIPMIRLAKPDSWWARRYYNAEKMLIARARFGIPPRGYVAPDVSSIEDFTEEDVAFQDKITRRAWEKARKRAQ
jgi:hypothetical protein